jgi:hypothetical protein
MVGSATRTSVPSARNAWMALKQSMAWFAIDAAVLFQDTFATLLFAGGVEMTRILFLTPPAHGAITRAT